MEEAGKQKTDIDSVQVCGEEKVASMPDQQSGAPEENYFETRRRIQREAYGNLSKMTKEEYRDSTIGTAVRVLAYYQSLPNEQVQKAGLATGIYDRMPVHGLAWIADYEIDNVSDQPIDFDADRQVYVICVRNPKSEFSEGTKLLIPSNEISSRAMISEEGDRQIVEMLHVKGRAESAARQLYFAKETFAELGADLGQFDTDSIERRETLQAKFKFQESAGVEVR
ncbi:MAG: hypothetical protein WC107_07315 [Patescibacteria group bacterium]